MTPNESESHFNFGEFVKTAWFAWMAYIFVVYLDANSPTHSGVVRGLGVILFFYAVIRSFNGGFNLAFLRAKETDQKEPEILKNSGVYFGYRSKQPRGKPFEKDGHILVVGRAGSGKSACIAIPTLKYFWGSRFLAVDIKGELEQKSGRKGLVLNPYRESTLGYDPFYLAKNSSDPESDIRDIALAIVPEPLNLKEPFWIHSAQNILTGFLLLAFKHGNSFIHALQNLRKFSPNTVLQAIQMDETARGYVMSLSSARPELVASIRTTLDNYITPFLTDKAIRGVLTRKSVLTPDHLEEGHGIYLQIPMAKIDQNKALFTLILQQFLHHFERRPEGNNPPVLLLLDEFANFGKLETIQKGLATLRSKKVTICIIIQSLAQLDAIYGENIRRSILDNCSYKAILNATDADTQRYFSQLVGTRRQEKYVYKEDNKNDPVTMTYEDKPRIKPEDFAYLSHIVLLHPKGWCEVAKVPHYEINRGH